MLGAGQTPGRCAETRAVGAGLQSRFLANRPAWCWRGQPWELGLAASSSTLGPGPRAPVASGVSRAWGRPRAGRCFPRGRLTAWTPCGPQASMCSLAGPQVRDPGTPGLEGSVGQQEAGKVCESGAQGRAGGVGSGGGDRDRGGLRPNGADSEVAALCPLGTSAGGSLQQGGPFCLLAGREEWEGGVE